MSRHPHPLLRELQAIGVTAVGIRVEESLRTRAAGPGALLLLNPSGRFPLTWWLSSGEPGDVLPKELNEVLARQIGCLVCCCPAELEEEAREIWGRVQIDAAIRRSARSSRKRPRRPEGPEEVACLEGASRAIAQLFGSLDVAPAGEFVEPNGAWGYGTWKPRDPREWASWLGPAPYRRDDSGRLLDGRRTRRSPAPAGVCEWCWRNRRSDDRRGDRYSSGHPSGRILTLCELCAAQSRLIGGNLARVVS